MKFYKIYFILSTLNLCQYTYSGCYKENSDELNEKEKLQEKILIAILYNPEETEKNTLIKNISTTN